MDGTSCSDLGVRGCDLTCASQSRLHMRTFNFAHLRVRTETHSTLGCADLPKQPAVMGLHAAHQLATVGERERGGVEGGMMVGSVNHLNSDHPKFIHTLLFCNREVMLRQF
ncbi:hypothetical protein ACTXT7_016561 [Hymenolepis weldensis]